VDALEECVRMMLMARSSDDVMDDYNWSDYEAAIRTAEQSVIAAVEDKR
jgi:hypothetical protein